MYLRWIPDLFSTKYLLLFLLALRTSKSNRNYHYMFAVYIWGGSWRPHVRRFIAFLFISPCPCGRFTNAGIWKKSQTRWKSPRLYVLAMAFSKLRKKSTVSITRTQNRVRTSSAQQQVISFIFQLPTPCFHFQNFLTKLQRHANFCSVSVQWKFYGNHFNIQRFFPAHQLRRLEVGSEFAVVCLSGRHVCRLSHALALAYFSPFQLTEDFINGRS